MTVSAAGGRPDLSRDGSRPLLPAGMLAAAVITAAGLAVATLVVLAGWIAAPHDASGLPSVLRAAAAIWLACQHATVTIRGAGRIGLLPLGFIAIPGALLWRGGRWLVRACRVRRLRHAGYAALALAIPYASLTGLLAAVSRSAVVAASVSQSAAGAFAVALAAAGLGGARALAPWGQLVRLLPQRLRSVVVAVAAALAVLVAGAAVLAAASLLAHLHDAAAIERELAPGLVGAGLLMLLQLAYLPNAVIWAIAFALGPGFAFGTGTVVAPTGAALAQLPAFPLLAALPAGVHPAMPGWLEPVVLAQPYLAGAVAGLLLVRAAPALALDVAPLWGLACGAVSGSLLGVLAAASGGPLGAGRLAAVGPSPWQAALVSALEIGIAAALSAGVANYLLLRRAGVLRPSAAGPASQAEPARHNVIFTDPWAGERPRRRPDPAGPSALP